MKKYIILFFLVSNAAYSQDKWNLQQCLNYATLHNPSVLSKKAQIGVDSIDLKIKQYNRLPKIELNGYQGFQLGNTYNISTGVGQKQSSYTRFNLTTSVNVFSGFVEKYRNQYQKIALKQSEYLYQDALWQLQNDVINTYLQVLYETENLKTVDFLITNQQKQIAVIEELFDQKYKSNEELLSAKIDLQKLALRKQATNKQIYFYKSELIELLNFDKNDIELQYNAVIKPSKTNIKSQINLDNHPHLLSTFQKLNLLNTEEKIEKSKRYPKITFNYSFGSNYYHIIGKEDLMYNQISNNFEPNGIWTQLKNNQLHYITIGVNIPILNGFKIKNNLKKINFKKQIATYNYQNEKRKILNSYKQLVNEIEFSAKQYNTQKKLFKLIEKNYKIKHAKYLQNLIPYYDWQHITNQYFEAKTKLLQAKYTYILKHEILKRLY